MRDFARAPGCSVHTDSLVCRVLVKVVVRGRLSAHLRALRDYALLAKGNFYSNFIQESHELMLKPPNLFSTRDVNYGPFATAAASSGVADDPHFRNCRLTLDLSEFVYRAFSPHSVALLHVRLMACFRLVTGKGKIKLSRRVFANAISLVCCLVSGWTGGMFEGKSLFWSKYER